MPLPPSLGLLAAVLLSALPAAGAALPDTLQVQDLVVVGDAAGPPAPSAVVFQPDALAAVTPWHAGDLEALIPAAAINVNSRGESLLMLRGAPERHVSVLLDGIPLAVPWDERTDLSLIPLDGVATLKAERGLMTVLAPPNGVAGSVELRTRSRNGPRASVELRAGSGDERAGRVVLRERRGTWGVTAAVSHLDRDGLALPDGADLAFHQDDDDLRTNTDLSQTSGLVRAVRSLERGGRLAVLLLGSNAERGVAPEGHQDDGARFWRLPLVRRGLAGVSLETPLSRDWDLEASAATDWSATNIRSFTDDRYSDAPLVDGDPLEQGRDRTFHAHARLRRFVSDASSVSAGARLRTTRHRERLTVGGEESTYAQRLVALGAEAELAGPGPWRARLGAGLDMAATPRSGAFPGQDARTEPALLLRLERRSGPGATLHAGVSRRSRFPSLRELYSGSLGRFEPNPDLAAERQDLAEAGWLGRWGRWDMAATAFAARLDGGIEKVRLTDGRFRRENRQRIRTAGLELALSGSLGGGVEVALHHALLDAAVDPGGGAPERPAEDRAAHQGAVLLEWRAGAWATGATGRWIGRRASADSSDDVDGLKALDSDMWADLWVSRTYGLGRGREFEVRLAVQNVGDAVVWEQAGLPGAGRAVVLGGRLEMP